MYLPKQFSTVIIWLWVIYWVKDMYKLKHTLSICLGKKKKFEVGMELYPYIQLWGENKQKETFICI